MWKLLKSACRGQLCKKAKLPSATLPVCTVKITNYYKETKPLKKNLTNDIKEPERKLMNDDYATFKGLWKYAKIKEN